MVRSGKGKEAGGLFSRAVRPDTDAPRAVPTFRQERKTNPCFCSEGLTHHSSSSRSKTRISATSTTMSHAMDAGIQREIRALPGNTVREIRARNEPGLPCVLAEMDYLRD